jgi:hypothetical protein
MPGNSTFIWNELVCSDVNTCGDFYADLLGWERKEVETHDGQPYTIFLKDGRAIGGMITLQDAAADTSHWEPYIQVDDVDAYVRKIAPLGGKVLTPPHDVPEIGRVALISDPSAARLALITEISQDEELP